MSEHGGANKKIIKNENKEKKREIKKNMYEKEKKIKVKSPVL
jgi:hypothetical protein